MTPEILKEIDNAGIVWYCRFHPTESFHEVGCPHQQWTVEQLTNALISKKRFEAYMAGRAEAVLAMPEGIPNAR